MYSDDFGQRKVADVLRLMGQNSFAYSMSSTASSNTFQKSTVGRRRLQGLLKGEDSLMKSGEQKCMNGAVVRCIRKAAWQMRLRLDFGKFTFRNLLLLSLSVGSRSSEKSKRSRSSNRVHVEHSETEGEQNREISTTAVRKPALCAAVNTNPNPTRLRHFLTFKLLHHFSDELLTENDTHCVLNSTRKQRLLKQIKTIVKDADRRVPQIYDAKDEIHLHRVQ